jgi:hypothetical protein
MKKLNILIGCEYSGALRTRFEKAAHNVWSCDLLPADDGAANHYSGDVFDMIDNPERWLGPNGAWDMMLAFPPCTYLTVSGAWLFAEREDIKRNVAADVLTGAVRKAAQAEAVEFTKRLMNCGIPKVCIENPARSFLCTAWRKPTQVIHPWEFGDDASKSTGLWLKGLEMVRARPSLHVKPRYVASATTGAMLPRWGNQTDSGQNREPPGALRWKKRSDTWAGIADAMVEDFLLCSTEIKDSHLQPDLFPVD